MAPGSPRVPPTPCAWWKRGGCSGNNRRVHIKGDMWLCENHYEEYKAER